MNAFAASQTLLAGRTFIKIAQGASPALGQAREVWKQRLDIAFESNALQLSLETHSMTMVLDMDHFMTKQSQQLRQRTILEEAADADQFAVGIATSPCRNHPVGPFAAVMWKLSVPKLLVEIREPGFQIIRDRGNGIFAITGEESKLLHF